MTVDELLATIAQHKADTCAHGVPVGGFRAQDRALWALLPECPRNVDQPAQLVLGLAHDTQEHGNA